MKKDYIHTSIDGRGKVKKVPAKPDDWSHRKPSEDRPKLLVKAPTKVKLKPTVMTVQALQQTFQNHGIHMDKNQSGWLVMVDDPPHRLTAHEQLDIMLEPRVSEKAYLILWNPARKHMVIDNLKGED